jgi:uncharacterized UPF0160 family protein
MLDNNVYTIASLLDAIRTLTRQLMEKTDQCEQLISDNQNWHDTFITLEKQYEELLAKYKRARAQAALEVLTELDDVKYLDERYEFEKLFTDFDDDEGMGRDL